jgi:hypothetical protein
MNPYPYEASRSAMRRIAEGQVAPMGILAQGIVFAFGLAKRS